MPSISQLHFIVPELLQWPDNVMPKSLLFSHETVFKSAASQINKEKNYQNLNETLRARRCDAASGHLVRRKPSGSSSEAIQQQFGSSQRQQLSNSQQLSSSLTVVAKYSWTYRSHW